MTCSWSAKPFAQYVHTRDQHAEEQDTRVKTIVTDLWLSLNDARRDCASERSSHHDKPDNPEGCQKPAGLLCRVIYPMVVNNGMLYCKLLSIQSNSGVGGFSKCRIGLRLATCDQRCRGKRPPARGARNAGPFLASRSYWIAPRPLRDDRRIAKSQIGYERRGLRNPFRFVTWPGRNSVPT
jgi:hypothetical protein